MYHPGLKSSSFKHHDEHDLSFHIMPHQKHARKIMMVRMNFWKLKTTSEDHSASYSISIPTILSSSQSWIGIQNSEFRPVCTALSRTRKAVQTHQLLNDNSWLWCTDLSAGATLYSKNYGAETMLTEGPIVVTSHRSQEPFLPWPTSHVLARSSSHGRRYNPKEEEHILCVDHTASNDIWYDILAIPDVFWLWGQLIGIDLNLMDVSCNSSSPLSSPGAHRKWSWRF